MTKKLIGWQIESRVLQTNPDVCPSFLVFSDPQELVYFFTSEDYKDYSDDPYNNWIVVPVFEGDIENPVIA